MDYQYKSNQDIALLDIIQRLEQGNVLIKIEQQSTTSTLDKRALSIAITHLETAQLWLANSRPD